MPLTAAQVWQQWSRDVPKFEGRSRVLKILKPLLGSREGRITRSWFTTLEGPALPYPTSNRYVSSDEAANLRAAADALFPLLRSIHDQCNHKNSLVEAVVEAVPDADVRQVRIWSAERYHNRVRKVGPAVISHLDESPRERAAVLAGQPVAKHVLQAADDAAIQELVSRYLEERAIAQWVDDVPDSTFQEAIGALTMDLAAVRQRVRDHLLDARKEKDFALPGDTAAFVQGVVVHLADESSFSPEVLTLWREWVDHGTEWIEAELRARKVFPGNRRYDLASTETYEVIGVGVRRFLVRVDLGLQTTDPEGLPGLRGWAKTRIRRVIGGYLKDLGHQPLAGLPPNQPGNDVPGPPTSGVDGRPSEPQAGYDAASDPAKKAVVTRMMEAIPIAAQSLPKMISDQVVAAVVEWLDGHGEDTLSEFERALAQPDAPAKLTKPGGALEFMADICHGDLQAAGMGLSKKAVRLLFATCAAAEPPPIDDDE